MSPGTLIVVDSTVVPTKMHDSSTERHASSLFHSIDMMLVVSTSEEVDSRSLLMGPTRVGWSDLRNTVRLLMGSS